MQYRCCSRRFKPGPGDSCFVCCSKGSWLSRGSDSEDEEEHRDSSGLPSAVENPIKYLIHQQLEIFAADKTVTPHLLPHSDPNQCRWSPQSVQLVIPFSANICVSEATQFMKLVLSPSVKNGVTTSDVQCLPLKRLWAALVAFSCFDHISCLTWVTANAILTMSVLACSPCCA